MTLEQQLAVINCRQPQAQDPFVELVRFENASTLTNKVHPQCGPVD